MGKIILLIITLRKFGNIPNEINWEKVYLSAKLQCVVPLVSSSVPDEHRNEWLEITYLSRAHYMQMIYEQHKLCYLFKNNNTSLNT